MPWMLIFLGNFQTAPVWLLYGSCMAFEWLLNGSCMVQMSRNFRHTAASETN